MRFRPCIDLHDGKVKQIIGGTLRDTGRSSDAQTNFVADLPPAYYANLYYRDGLEGGHVIMLGPNNADAAKNALSAHPGNLQLGGGITPDNAPGWLDSGAAKVIVTSYIFDEAGLSFARLDRLATAVPPERLVLDLSCKKQPDGSYRIAYNRWQSVCPVELNKETFRQLAGYCSEFLVHAVDVEGRQNGIDPVLAERLACECPLPVTYAGGARSMADVLLLERIGHGRVDVTVGSALDLFGGTGIAYRDLVAFDRAGRNTR